MAPAVLHRVIYGSSKPAAWQAALTTVRPALLQKYSRRKVRHADYPAIIPVIGNSVGRAAAGNANSNGTAEQPSVRGSVVTGLTEGDLWRLDIFEGSQYVRRKVKVRVLPNTDLEELASASTLQHLEDLEEVEAETYVWSDNVEDLESEEWDFEEFKREKMWAWISGGNDDVRQDEGFGDVDRAVANAEREKAQRLTNGGHDPTGGRGRGGKITEELERAAV